MNLAERLEAAKAKLLETGWGQGTINSRLHRGSLCLSEALNMTAPDERYKRDDGPLWEMHIAICKAIGVDVSDPMSNIITWNDVRIRTKDQVLEVFDKAIEAARAAA